MELHYALEGSKCVLTSNCDQQAHIFHIQKMNDRALQKQILFPVCNITISQYQNSIVCLMLGFFIYMLFTNDGSIIDI